MYATLGDLLLRASADDLARAASRDSPAAVDGPLLVRAAAEPQPLDAAALARLRTESGEVLHAGASPDAAFAAAEFTESSITGTVAMPEYAAPSWLALAVPASSKPLESVVAGAGAGFAFNQISAFEEQPQPIEIDGVACRWWRTKRQWSARSAGVEFAVAPFGGGEALWDAAAVAALPAVLARIDAALADADAEIDGRVAGRYPALAPTRTLAAKAVDLAVFGLVGGAEDSENARRWKAAIDWLRDVAAGRIDLEAPEPPPDDGPASAALPPPLGGALAAFA